MTSQHNEYEIWEWWIIELTTNTRMKNKYNKNKIECTHKNVDPGTRPSPSPWPPKIQNSWRGWKNSRERGRKSVSFKWEQWILCRLIVCSTRKMCTNLRSSEWKLNKNSFFSRHLFEEERGKKEYFNESLCSLNLLWHELWPKLFMTRHKSLLWSKVNGEHENEKWVDLTFDACENNRDGLQMEEIN